MKVAQIYEILNTMKTEILGETEDVVKEDLSNIVDVGKKLFESGDVEQLFKTLINHIGKVVFVNRLYSPVVPSIMKDGWEYGSILEKIDADMPDSEENKKWSLENGGIYEQDKFVTPKNVRMKLFNQAVTYQVAMSYTTDQLKQSFSSASELNAFMSMIETKIKNRMAIDYSNLIRSTINNMIAATMYRDYSTALSTETHKYTFPTTSGVRAVNLLAKYRSEGGDMGKTLTLVSALKDLDFLKFAVKEIMMYSDRMRDMSKLFNIGSKERFTPKDLQHLVMHTEFQKSADIYLQSDTFHDEYTRLPKSETINFWQATGDDYAIPKTTAIHTVSNVTADGNTIQAVETIFNGVVCVMFDHDALGVNNERNQTTSHYNGNGDFYNFWYKSFARYFNDYDENCVVFFIA